MSSFSRPFTFDRVVRLLLGAAGVTCAVWLIGYLSNVLLPFCLACLVAYILEPLLDFNRRIFHLKGRVLATFITLAEVTAVLGALLYIFLPSTISEISEMEAMIHRYARSDVDIPFVPKEVHDFIRNDLKIQRLGDLINSQHFESLLNKGTMVLSGTLSFLFHTLQWFLAFIYVIFIMIDYNRLMTGFKLLVPPRYRKVAYRVGNDIKNSMNRYFRGQAILALCAAVFYCIGFSIVGLPLAIVLGITVGLLYMIPYFQYVTVIPVLLVCLLSSMSGAHEFWPLVGQCAIVYVVSQCICDYVLTPKIMGKAMGLNPAIILLSLSVWGTLLGLIGMIIALPLTTLLLAYYQEFVISRRDKSSPAAQIPARTNRR